MKTEIELDLERIPEKYLTLMVGSLSYRTKSALKSTDPKEKVFIGKFIESWYSRDLITFNFILNNKENSYRYLYNNTLFLARSLENSFGTSRGLENEFRGRIQEHQKVMQMYRLTTASLLIKAINRMLEIQGPKDTGKLYLTNFKKSLNYLKKEFPIWTKEYNAKIRP